MTTPEDVHAKDEALRRCTEAITLALQNVWYAESIKALQEARKAADEAYFRDKEGG